MLITSSWIIDGTICATLICLLVYKYLTRNFDYWEKRNIPYLKPVLFFGNFYEVFTFKTTIQEHIKKIYDRINAPYFGIFIFDEPVLVLKSPELIKDVLIKDAAIFSNRRVTVPNHPLMEQSLFFMKFPHWKTVRTKISPAFTSSMLKTTHNGYLTDICNLMVEFLNKNDGVIDGRRVGELFATDLIFKCFYGADAGSFSDKPSAFEHYLEKMSEFNLRNAIIQNMYFLKPELVKVLKLDFISESVMQFFERVFKKGMESRKDYTEKPLNFVDFANRGMREKQNGQEDVLDVGMAVSTAIFFLIAGRDTLVTLIAFTLYELAINETIQTKLRKEIKDNVEKYKGITYEGVHDNRYLEMCINESMRKYPPIPFLDRMPITDYKFNGTDRLAVKKNISVVIPFFALHRDEKYFPNSEEYNPERFAEDMPSEGLAYVPFGAGPRSCIGKRLGMLGLLVSLSYIVLNFKIERCPETPSKIEFEPKSFPLISKVGLPIKITRLKD